MSTTWAIIGATGRLGRALRARLGDCRVHGLARHEPQPGHGFDRFLVADRRDPAALDSMLDGAQVIVDLCAFDGADVAPLVSAMAACTAPPRLLILASSLAERPVSRWPLPASEMGDDPPLRDAHGLGKRAARTAFADLLATPTLTLLLPQLLCTDDPNARERVYVEQALRSGHALLPGNGRQRPAVAPVAGVAQTIVALSSHRWTDSEVVQVAPPRGPTVIALVEALLSGAGLAPRWQLHEEQGWRGPHSDADEVVHSGRLQQLAPDLSWPDPLVEMGRLGAFLRTNPRP